MHSHTQQTNKSWMGQATRMSFRIGNPIHALERLFYTSHILDSFHFHTKKDQDDSFYTPLNQAVAEVKRRFEDTALRERVKEYLGSEPPSVFQTKPRAALFRNIMTPSTELLRFLSLTAGTGIQPLGLEYTADKFSTRNQEKLMLVKLPLLFGKGKNGDLIIQKKKIVDIKANDNVPFRDILTLGNESLPHFHHCLLDNYLDAPLELFDMSDWVKKNGSRAKEYYKKFFAIFVSHGILFETFLTSGSESAFTENVVRPAFELVKNELGIKPLIVKSIDETMGLDYWVCYPGEVIK